MPQITPQDKDDLISGEAAEGNAGHVQFLLNVGIPLSPTAECWIRTYQLRITRPGHSHTTQIPRYEPSGCLYAPQFLSHPVYAQFVRCQPQYQQASAAASHSDRIGGSQTGQVLKNGLAIVSSVADVINSMTSVFSNINF